MAAELCSCGHPREKHSDVKPYGVDGSCDEDCDCLGFTPMEYIRVGVVTISGRLSMYRLDAKAVEELKTLRVKPKTAVITQKLWDEYSRHVAEATEWQSRLTRIKEESR